MTKQNANGSTIPNETVAVGGIASPPDPATLIAAPSGYIARPKGSVPERRVMLTQKQAVFAAVNEVRNADDYATIFGQIAPDQGDLVNALGVAGGWSVDVRQVMDWLAYAKDEEKNAWLHALPLLDAMQPALEAAIARRPELGSRFAALLRYYAIGRARGRTAARGRVKAKQAAANDAGAKAPADAPSAPTTPPATAPTTGAKATGSAAPTVEEAHRAA